MPSENALVRTASVKCENQYEKQMDISMGKLIGFVCRGQNRGSVSGSHELRDLLRRFTAPIDTVGLPPRRRMSETKIE